MITLDLSNIKAILYAYTREEDNRKGFYNIINEDLRSGDPNIIFKHLELIGEINRVIINKEIASFQGKVYRATFLEESLVKKLKVGEKLMNASFWSASKAMEVPQKLLISQQKRNCFIIAEAKQNNIDIHKENISAFINEQEVLFVPFNVFLIKDICEFSINIGNNQTKRISQITVEEIPELNPCIPKNFTNINTNDLNYYQYIYNGQD